MGDDKGSELVVRVSLKPGVDRDVFAQMITSNLSENTHVDVVIVDMQEGPPDETRALATVGGLTLEETKRLYVRFGPQPDERIRLARQQFSMLGMIMGSGLLRGSKVLLAALQRFDPEGWGESDVGSATKIYSRVAELMKRTNMPLTQRKGVYGFMAQVIENRPRKI